MAIREADDVLTRKDLDGSIDIAVDRLAAARTAQRQAFEAANWRAAKDRDSDVSTAEHWVTTLYEFRRARFGDAAQARITATLDELRAFETTTLRPEYSRTLSAALERPTEAGYRAADIAWRALSSFRNEAAAATGDAQAFSPRGTPGPPSQHLELATFARARNPMEPRSPVDRSRWATLLPTT